MSSWILFPVCHIHNYHTFGIPAQPKPAKTLLCHRSPCRPGIPVPVSCVLRAPLLFPSGDRTAEQLYKAEHPIPVLHRSPMSFKIVLRPSEMVSLCLPGPSRAALQSSAQGRRHSVWEGRGSSMGVVPPASASPSLFLFLVCLSHLCYCSEPRSFLPLSCTAPLTLICQSCPAILCHPRKKGRNASGWQVSRQLCHGGPPSIVEPPFGSYCSRFFPPILLLFTIVAGTIE